MTQDFLMQIRGTHNESQPDTEHSADTMLRSFLQDLYRAGHEIADAVVVTGDADVIHGLEGDDLPEPEEPEEQAGML